MLLQRTVRGAVVGRCGAVRAASSQVAMIKELRAQTNAPILDCKKSLTAEGVDGDFAKAVDYLRAKGIASAMKRSGKAASEGAVGAVVDTVGSSIRGAVVEVRCQNVAQCTRMYSGTTRTAAPVSSLEEGSAWVEWAGGRVAGTQGCGRVAGTQEWMDGLGFQSGVAGSGVAGWDG